MALVLPVHEQLYPSKLLPTRLQEYVFTDGRPPTQNRTYAVRVTGQQVLDALAGAQTDINPRYFVGTCFHEAGCSNEWDTEIATASSPAGFQSVGAYQIGDEEARRYGYALADMLDFDKATACMVKLANDNRLALRSYAKLAADAPDPDYTDPSGIVWKGGTMRAYLAVAHNHGTGYAKQTIAMYGMNWATYQQRNPTDRIVSNAYGEDCVTGGSQYPGSSPVRIPGSRTLQLTSPMMTGADVTYLQQHLAIIADGEFGPGTQTILRSFQSVHGLTADGVCGPATWNVILST